MTKLKIKAAKQAAAVSAPAQPGFVVLDHSLAVKLTGLAGLAERLNAEAQRDPAALEEAV